MNQFCSRYSIRLLVVLSLSGIVIGMARAQAPTPPAAAPGATGAPPAAANKPAGPTLETPQAADKVVLKVGDQQFTKADIDSLIQGLNPQAQRSIASQGKKSLGDQFATVVMLAQQAHLHHLDQSPEFIHKLEFQKQQLAAQAAYDEIHQQAKVTPEEINKYYTEHSTQYDEILGRQFVIRKKAADAKPDSAHPTPAGQGLSADEAKTRAEAIRKEVAAGTDIKKVIEDFKAPGDVTIEAEPRKVRRGGMRPDMEKVAFALKDGEISEPVDIPQALIFFQVTGHSHVDLKDVTPEIDRALQKEKVDAALAEVKKGTTLWMDDQYFAPPLKLSEGPTLGPSVAKTPAKP
jgi:hypothetical protein